MALTEQQKEYQKKYYEKKKQQGKTRTPEVRLREQEYNRKYRKQHAEKMRQQRQQVDKKLRRQREKEWRENNKERTREYAARWRMGKAAFDGAKQRAKRKGVEFSITRKYLDSITPTHCPIFGVEFKSGMANRDCNVSLDRIDNTKGYVEGNVVVICYKANRMKSNGTIAELSALVNFYQTLLTKTKQQVIVASLTKELCSHDQVADCYSRVDSSDAG